MKLECSLPERPGWIFVTPGFDFVLLLLALVLLTGVVAKESLVEVQLPPSEFRGLRMGEDNYVVVMVRNGRRGPVYYVGKEQVAEVELEAAITAAVETRDTDTVAVFCDKRVELGVEQMLTGLVTRLDLRYLRAIRLSREGGE